jgi:SecDF, P1 head subdomain
MLMWTRRQAGMDECSGVFCHVAGQIFALAILVLWSTSALAAPLTLRVVEASPRFTPEPSIVVRFDHDGAMAFAQFTSEHVSQVVEFRVAGRTLMAPQVQEPILGGIITILVRADEIAEVANRITTEGRIEVNAIGWPKR